MTSTTAHVPTENGSRYLQQLCKHWSHKFETAFDADRGTVHFPGGAVATMVTASDALIVTIEAPDADTRDRMKTVLAEHLDRFAFREAPLAFDWKDAA